MILLEEIQWNPIGVGLEDKEWGQGRKPLQGLGSWDDFLRRNPIEPHRGGPRGQGVGTRERITTGVRKVVYKNVQEASASTSTHKVTKKRTSISEASTSKWKKLLTKTTEENSK